MTNSRLKSWICPFIDLGPITACREDVLINREVYIGGGAFTAIGKLRPNDYYWYIDNKYVIRKPSFVTFFDKPGNHTLVLKAVDSKGQQFVTYYTFQSVAEKKHVPLMQRIKQAFSRGKRLELTPSNETSNESILQKAGMDTVNLTVVSERGGSFKKNLKQAAERGIERTRRLVGTIIRG